MVKRILILLAFALITVQSFGQFQEENRRTKSIPFILNQDISVSRYFIWHGDTIDFTNIIDSLYLTTGDSGIFVTYPYLDSVIATLPGGHDPVTIDSLGTIAGMYINNDQILGMMQAGPAQNGWLSWEDWIAFNEKLSWVYHDSTLIGEGTFLNPLRVDTALFNNNFDNTGDWQGTWFGHDTTYFITKIENDAFSAAWNGDLDGASKNAIYDYLASLSFGVTNLSNTAFPATVTVYSSNGTDTNLPLATQVNAGLLSPGDKAKLDTLRYPIDTVYVTPDAVFPIEYLNYREDLTERYVTDIPKPDGLFMGGIVTWQFGLTFSVSPAAYYISGTLFTSASTNIALTAADGTNSRVDLFVVDTLGQVVVIEGTPSSNPQTPSYDPTSQIPLTSVLILANATTPSPVNPGDTLFTEVIYDENVEWTAGYSGVVTAFNSTVSVHTGSVSAEANTTGAGDYLYFSRADSISVSSLETVSFWIQLKETMGRRDRFAIHFLHNGTLVSNIRMLNIDRTSLAWQNVSIAFDELAFSSEYFDEVVISYLTFKGNEIAGFYFDYFILQGGIEVPVSFAGDDWGDQFALVDGTMHGNGLIGNELGVDTSKIATKYDVDTLAQSVYDSLLVHRTEIESIKDSLDIHRENINAVIDSISVHRTELETVKDSLTVHRSEIETVKDSLLVHRIDITRTLDSLVVHRSQLDSLFQLTSVSDSVLLGLIDSVADVNIRIDALFDSITLINNHITNLYDSITEINVELNNLWDTVIQNSYDIDNILDSLTVINNKILTLDADNWGTQVVEHDETLIDAGTIAAPLRVDTTLIATKFDIDTTNVRINDLDSLIGEILLTGGDNWGTQVVEHDNTLIGQGTAADPLKADTTKLATKYDIDTLSQTVQQIDSTLGTFVDTDDQTAAEVSYSNTTSGLTATDVQNAIDEIDNAVDGIIATGGDGWGTDTVVHDGTLNGQGTSPDPLRVADDAIGYTKVATALKDTLVDNDLSWDFSEAGIIYSTVTGGGTLALSNGQINKTLTVVLTISSFTSVTIPAYIHKLAGSVDIDADGVYYLDFHCIGTNLYRLSITKEAT